MNVYQVVAALCMLTGMAGAFNFSSPENAFISIEHSVMLLLVGALFYAISDMLACLRQIVAALSYVIDEEYRYRF